MQNERQSERASFENDESRVTAALVCVIAVERWPEVRSLIRELGGRLIYQRLAAPTERLWIIDREPSKEGSR